MCLRRSGLLIGLGVELVEALVREVSVALPIETGMDVVLITLSVISKGEVRGSTRLEKSIYVIQKESGIQPTTNANRRASSFICLNFAQ